MYYYSHFKVRNSNFKDIEQFSQGHTLISVRAMTWTQDWGHHWFPKSLDSTAALVELHSYEV